MEWQICNFPFYVKVLFASAHWDLREELDGKFDTEILGLLSFQRLSVVWNLFAMQSTETYVHNILCWKKASALIYSQEEHFDS